MSNWGFSAVEGSSVSIPIPSQGTGNISEEEAEKVQEPENEEECFERFFSSGHHMAVVHVNSQQQWLPDAPPLDKLLLATDGCWGINDNFL